MSEMLRTLYARLSAALVLIFLAIGLLYVLITKSTTEHYLQELTQHFNRDLAQRIVADRHLVSSGQLDQQALKATFSAYMDINPSIEIYLLDHAGKILAYSADPGVVKREQVDLGPIQAFLNGEDFPLLGDDPRSHDRRKAFSVTRVPAGDLPSGYLYVVLRGEQYDSAEEAVQARYAMHLSFWAVAGSLGFGLLAGLLLFHLLTRRLERLAGAMDAFQRSDFTRRQAIAEEGKQALDEVERLGQTFDQMAQRIIAQWGQLKDQDRLRRELIAQISHDLRTPLAAMHGYIETLQMKSAELDDSRRAEYLGIVLRQSRQLKRMVEALFELAQLEARETRVQIEPIGLAELLQDVVQKFQLRAQQEKVTLEMAEPPALPMVMADVALCERALDNLIGNAIDHTPEGGRVRVEIGIEADNAVVKVSDTGAGIPAQDLERIFDPFYRGGKAGKDRAHAGLGLAISKRIVELQAGRLSADNLSKGGSCFSFTLPLQSA